MDTATAKSVVDFIFQSPSPVITLEFTGGEPLLNYPIVKYMIEYAEKLNENTIRILNMLSSPTEPCSPMKL
jgi:sulfatase maturation enzyme AslB (radical SAM superfamily)